MFISQFYLLVYNEMFLISMLIGQSLGSLYNFHFGGGPSLCFPCPLLRSLVLADLPDSCIVVSQISEPSLGPRFSVSGSVYYLKLYEHFVHMFVYVIF